MASSEERGFIGRNGWYSDPHEGALPGEHPPRGNPGIQGGGVQGGDVAPQPREKDSCPDDGERGRPRDPVEDPGRTRDPSAGTESVGDRRLLHRHRADRYFRLQRARDRGLQRPLQQYAQRRRDGPGRNDHASSGGVRKQQQAPQRRMEEVLRRVPRDPGKTTGDHRIREYRLPAVHPRRIPRDGSRVPRHRGKALPGERPEGPPQGTPAPLRHRHGPCRRAGVQPEPHRAEGILRDEEGGHLPEPEPGIRGGRGGARAPGPKRQSQGGRRRRLPGWNRKATRYPFLPPCRGCKT